MLIRLLQSFSSFSLDETAFTAEGRAPADWASSPGRKGIDKFRPRAHLTMYSTVSRWISRHRRLILSVFFQDGMWIQATEAVNVEEESSAAA